MSDTAWPFELPDRRGAGRPLDVVCLGHALVDRLAFVSRDAIEAADLALGAMTLVDGPRAAELGGAAEGWRQVAGGSAANTAAGIASLGGRPGFAGAVGDDAPGSWYATDLEAGGVECHVTAVSTGVPTGLCHVFVTDNGDRSMATHLGAAGELAVATVEQAGIERARVLYVEGYLLDAPLSSEALARALELARESGTVVALSLSDPFVVDRHRERIAELVFGGTVGILLGNEEEALSLTGAKDFAGAKQVLHREGLAAVVTRGAEGAVALTPLGETEVAPWPGVQVQDTTGAGDLFAAGFLFGLTQGAGAEAALHLASFAAGEVIGHLGARPAVRLAETAPTV